MDDVFREQAQKELDTTLKEKEGISKTHDSEESGVIIGNAFADNCAKCGQPFYLTSPALTDEERETFGSGWKVIKVDGRYLCPECLISVLWQFKKNKIRIGEVGMDNAIEKKEQVLQAPEDLKEFGIRVAHTLKNIIDSKPKKVIINKEQYIEYEDWQLVGAPFGITVQTGEPEPVEIEGVKGAKAKATVYKNGVLIGGAEAYCLRDEANWKEKPWFQLASMAQTRAGAKALRNVLSWVVVLAGYKTTPAEEMINGQEGFINEKDTRPITEPQKKRLYAIRQKSGIPNDVMHSYIVEKFHIENANQIERWMYDDVCTFAETFAPPVE